MVLNVFKAILDSMASIFWQFHLKTTVFLIKFDRANEVALIDKVKST